MISFYVNFGEILTTLAWITSCICDGGQWCSWWSELRMVPSQKGYFFLLLIFFFF